MFTTNSPPGPLQLIYDLSDRDGYVMRVRGRLLGFATSQRSDHSHPEVYGPNDRVARSDAVLAAELLHTSLADRLLNTRDDLATRAVTNAAEQLRNYVARLTGTDELNELIVSRYALRSERCSACRWFEARVFAVDSELPDCECDVPSDASQREHAPGCAPESARAYYALETRGRTTVPGEINLHRVAWTDSPYELVSLLTQRGTSGRSFLPQTADRVLAQAAYWDDQIRDAYLAKAA